eukprot:Amastigsp_a427_14.p5 type:complete len:129 gc:universal Amastigsp_a427_14:1229-1615(+)
MLELESATVSRVVLPFARRLPCSGTVALASRTTVSGLTLVRSTVRIHSATSTEPRLTATVSRSCHGRDRGCRAESSSAMSIREQRSRCEGTSARSTTAAFENSGPLTRASKSSIAGSCASAPAATTCG